MSIAIQTYRNSAEQNRVDKSNYMTPVNTINGVLRGETSLTNMSIRIESDEVPNFNYVYIEAFSRFYFVTDITHIRRKLWEITLAVDVLMTYKDAILETYGFVDRNEYLTNPLLLDKKRIIEQGVDVEDIEIPNNLFTTPASVDASTVEFRYVLNGYKITTTNESWLVTE